MSMQYCPPDGTFATMVTPFTPDYKIDYTGVDAIVEWYIEHGVTGIFAVCQSSEMFALSLRERTALAAHIIDLAKGRIQVVVSGHVSEAMEDQIEELRQMAALSPDTIVLVSNRLARAHESDAVWKQNAQRILDAIPDVAFGIYECPYPYKRLLSPELLAWCASTGRFVFLKDTCCDIEQIKDKLAAVSGTGLKIYNANAATLLASLEAGCSGFCGVMLNFHPELYVKLCRIFREDPKEAARLQHFATLASLIEGRMYPTCAKHHMALRGLPVGLQTRTRDMGDFTALMQTETDHLFHMWEEFPFTP